MYTDILIRFGELSTKGKNKMTFVRKLEKNIKKLMNKEPVVEYDRMFLKYSQENMEGLKYIFGIQSWSPVIKIKTDLEEMEKYIFELTKNISASTFKVAVKRHWKGFPKTSSELNGHFGGLILKKTDLKVDVKNPDIKFELEIRKDFTYIFAQRFIGLGGYPTGVNGKVLHLISGGIDSPVAAFEMMKRGIHVDFLNFITPPHTDNKTIEKVNAIVKYLMKFQGECKLFRSNYTELMQLIGMVSNQSYKISLMRRSFYRIASALAKKYKYLGISNGDNLGQVASQTLESINVIQDQALLPVYRPLLTRDKIETINQAIKLKTYEISILKASESCELFAPKAPVIKPTISEAKRLEDELSSLKELEEKNIIQNIDIIKITHN